MAEPETTAAASISSQKDLDTEMEQLAALRAELERVNVENVRFRNRELVPLQEKVADTSFTSLKKEMDDHVKGIHSRMDKIDKNQELFVDHLKISKSTTPSTPEDPSTKGEKDKEDKDDNSNADADRSNKDGEGNADRSNKDGEGASGKDSSAADKDYDKSKGKMPESENIFTNQDYDNIPKDVNDDDAFDAAYFEAEEEGRFEESFLYTEDQSVDPEHLERVRKFKAEHEDSKARLQELQKLVDEKRTTDELVKLEKQKLWDAKCKKKREDISRKVGEN
ncbi:uncharacterized protein LOC135147223 [Daucus carota subsp. sativus]|uniref:uncharacterized protein LOC135147223 n=1 Tax=Daucus carota subsp. sativus TaxID=79200 RepID=UPI003083D37C